MKKAEEILEAVAEASGVSKGDIKSSLQKDEISIARGVFCFLCQENKVKSRLISKILNRKIRTIQYLSKTYKEHYQIGDKEVVRMADKCVDEIRKRA